MLTPVLAPPSRFPTLVRAKGLRFISYTLLAFVCIFLTFALGQTRAHAAGDVIDLTFHTVGSGESISLPIGTASGNPAYTNVVIHWGDGAVTTVTSNSDATDMTHTYAAGNTTYTVTVGAPAKSAVPRFMQRSPVKV